MRYITSLRSTITLGLAVAACVTLCALPAQTAPHRRALLVGVSSYGAASGGALADLHAGADVDMLRNVLATHFGLPQSDVTALKQPRETSKDSIIRAFRSRLIDTTEPGDVVFFHFSGRGTQRTDGDNEEADGLDEAILAASEGKVEEITDDEIRGLIEELRARKPASITLSFDCGFSSAGIESGRLRLRGHRSDDGVVARPGAEVVSEFCGGPFETRDELGVAPEVTVISACRQGQNAAETETADGSPAGLMTWALATALADCGSRSTSQSLIDRMTDLVSIRRPGQSPLLLGRPSNPVLGGRATSSRTPDRRLGYKWSPLRVDLSGTSAGVRAELTERISALGYATSQPSAEQPWSLRVREVVGGPLVVEREDGSSVATAVNGSALDQVVASVRGEATWRYARSLAWRGPKVGAGFLARLEPMRYEQGALRWPLAYAGQPLFAQGDRAKLVLDSTPKGRYLTIVDVQDNGTVQAMNVKGQRPVLRFATSFSGTEALIVVAARGPVEVDTRPGQSTPFVLRMNGKALGESEYSAAGFAFTVLPAGWHEATAMALATLGRDTGNVGALLASADIQISLLGAVSGGRGIHGLAGPGDSGLLEDLTTLGPDNLVALARSSKGRPGIAALADEMDANSGLAERGSPWQSRFQTVSLASGARWRGRIGRASDKADANREDTTIVSVRGDGGARIKVELLDANQKPLIERVGTGQVALEAKAKATDDVSMVITNLDSSERKFLVVVK